jgi:hypothetical protein
MPEGVLLLIRLEKRTTPVYAIKQHKPLRRWNAYKTSLKKEEDQQGAQVSKETNAPYPRV